MRPYAIRRSGGFGEGHGAGISTATVVSREVAIAEAVAALVRLLAAQELTRYFQSRFLRVHHVVRQRPQVVLWDGVLLEDRLRASSASADEIRAAVRKAGHRSLSDVRIVVLENDGDWSVVPKRHGESDESAFSGLPIPGLRRTARGTTPQSPSQSARTGCRERKGLRCCSA